MTKFISEIKNRFAITLELAFLTILVSAVSGIGIGVISALRQDTILDYLMRSFSILNLSVPYFWSGFPLRRSHRASCHPE